MSTDKPYLEKATRSARTAASSLGDRPGDYLSEQFSRDFQVKEGETVYALETESKTYEWLDTLDNNFFHQVTDTMLSPLTGYEKRLSGIAWMEGVALAADKHIDMAEEIRVETPDWSRTISEPEWHEIANTALESAKDLGAISDRFRNGAEWFIEDKK
jgi:hypothetical protein